MITQETKTRLERRLYPNLEKVVFGAWHQELASRLGRDAVVLDSGCGPGSWVLQEQRDRIALLVGEDLYVPAERNTDVLVLAPCTHLPFAASSFDLVLAYLVLEHLPTPEAAFREYARVLKPGGYFCFKTPAVRTPLFLLARLLPIRLHQHLKASVGTASDDVFPTYYRANTVSGLHRALTASGFAREWLCTVDQTYAYLSQTAWSYALGLLYSRLTQVPFLRCLRNQILGIYRRLEDVP